MSERAADHQAGYLSKNHAGGKFSKESQRRFFDTLGFTVSYFRESDKRSLKGHFDLRNVVKIAPNADADDLAAAGDGAADLTISEEGKANKVMTISFKEAPGDRDAWLRLWCSAIESKYVAEPFQSFIDAPLSELLNMKYATQDAVSRQRSMFGNKVEYTKVLTPRQPSKANLSSALDTPRDTRLPNPAPLPPPKPAEADAPTTFEITVPDGVKPGDRLQATTPQGTKVKLVVPQGAEPGMLLTFQVPKDAGKKKKKTEAELSQERSAIVIQARLRGMKVRKAKGGATPTVAKPAMAQPVDEELSKAAVKVQSAMRGLTTRNAQQEEARVQWLEYYVETQEWEQAKALAVTDEEDARIEKARLANSVPEEELRRQKWFQHYLKEGKYAEAAKVVNTPVEVAMVLKSQTLRANRCFSCLPKYELEDERVKEFVAAVRKYDWEVAEVLAMSKEELQDVADSRTRVEYFGKALEEHKYDDAARLAITEEEEAAVAQARGAADAEILGVLSDPEAQRAALKVQAMVRGHQTRDQHEEVRRVEWLRYYAADGQLDEAAKLVIKPEEEAALGKVRQGDKAALELIVVPKIKSAGAGASKPAASKPAASKPGAFKAAIVGYRWEEAAALASSEQERQDLDDSKARVQWLGQYVEQKEYDRAKALAITETEVRRIEWLQAGKTFADAVKSYEWAVAMQLATSDVERSDVADSEARVQWMEKHITDGHYEKARELAITESELHTIQTAAGSKK